MGDIGGFFWFDFFLDWFGWLGYFRHFCTCVLQVVSKIAGLYQRGGVKSQYVRYARMTYKESIEFLGITEEEVAGLFGYKSVRSMKNSVGFVRVQNVLMVMAKRCRDILDIRIDEIRNKIKDI